jgi:hypothetical protein
MLPKLNADAGLASNTPVRAMIPLILAVLENMKNSSICRCVSLAVALPPALREHSTNS